MTQVIDPNHPIGIFDSGVGGLTVLKEIYDYLPNEDIIYLGDTARVPYGPRPLSEVRRYVLEISNFLFSEGAKIIVIACNTGTAAGLLEAREMISLPIIGVIEPGAKAAVNATKKGKIGVIGTAGTVNSQAYDIAIRKIDSSIEVVSVPCPVFVDFVEQGNIESPQLLEAAYEHLAQLIGHEVDTLILGCTHFPLIRNSIAQVMGQDVTIISSAEETAKEVAIVVSEFANKKIGRGMSRFLSTDNTEDFKIKGSLFLGKQIDAVEHISIDELDLSFRNSIIAK